MHSPASSSFARSSRLAGIVAGLSLVASGFAQTDTEADGRAIRQMQGNGASTSSSSSSWPDNSSFRYPENMGNSHPANSKDNNWGSSQMAITFFPPMPPLYGSTLPEPSFVNTTINGRPLTAPDELADFVGETFYPALGTRFFQGKLNPKQESQLAAYRTARNTLLDELMEELVRLSPATRAEREAALKAFAPKQAARLEALERDAERLRRELTGETFDFSTASAIGERRRWRLGDATVATAPARHDAEHYVVRATAYFQPGLMIEQRGLLLEIAMEAARSANVSRGRRDPSTDDAAASFFSPEMSRLKLPTPLPQALFSQVARFNTEKAALKKELMDVVVITEKFSPGKRLARFEGLGTSQKSRIVAQETLAEEIRRGLDALGDAPPPWMPPIPQDLRDRIDAYNRERAALFTAQAAAQKQATLEAAHAALPPRGDKTPAAARAETLRLRMEAVREVSRRFDQQNAEQIRALRERYDRIYSELVDAARGVKDPQTQREMTVDDLLAAHRVALQRFETIGREEAMYERYKYAMLQPGLSPAQRRLLFRAGHASLAQALPQGEFFFPNSTKPRPVY